MTNLSLTPARLLRLMVASLFLLSSGFVAA